MPANPIPLKTPGPEVPVTFSDFHYDNPAEYHQWRKQMNIPNTINDPKVANDLCFRIHNALKQKGQTENSALWLLDYIRRLRSESFDYTSIFKKQHNQYEEYITKLTKKIRQYE